MEAIGPTDERVRHADPVTIAGREVRIAEIPTDRAGVMAHQVALPHVLEKYYAQKLFAADPDDNRRLFLAGCAVREAYEESGLEPTVVGGYEPAVDGFRDPSGTRDRAIDAGRRFNRLMSYAGPECYHIVRDVCCGNKTAGRGEAMARLRRGLRRIADEIRC